MESLDKIIQKLNEDQVKPVFDTEGHVLVIAGAGSGKTRVLTSRIAYLVMNNGVEPKNIMAITFTNKAAGEMKERLKGFFEFTDDMWVSTIHSMCVKILRRDIGKLGYDTNFTIYDEGDKDRVLKSVIKDLGFNDDKILKSAKNHISIAKNDCLSPEQFLKENSNLYIAQDIYSIYKEYENRMAKCNCLDFDDLLYKTYELFVSYPEIAHLYSNRFKYIHVDEFQDTNFVQFEIIKMLAGVHGNLFVVGDDDQSIYGWRGAVIDNILNFDKIYTDAKVYKLERNYRSTKNILDLANCVIQNNRFRRSKRLWTSNEQGEKIQTYVGNDENEEATFTALKIKSLLENDNYSDFAVFMRVNALSRAYEQEFTKYNIPYRVFGGMRFFERKEIKDILSYIKVIVNIKDDEAFLRCISTPKRGIGDKTVAELKEYCSGSGLSLYEGLSFLDSTTISGSAKTKLNNFKQLLDGFSVYANEHNAFELMNYILETTSFCDQFKEDTEENVSRIYNINELKNTAEMFVRDNPTLGVCDYLNSVTLSTDTDEINENNVVTIATIHAVKGLEYKNVFICGLDEKILPLGRAYDDESEMEEERRLMYVAVTRAREKLFLTRAFERFLYGCREGTVESRFLKEARPLLSSDHTGSAYSQSNSFSQREYRQSYYKPQRRDDRYVPDFGDNEIFSSSDSSGYSSGYAKTFLNSVNKPKENNNVDTSKFKMGQKVMHKKFGEGTVILVKGSGDNTILDIAFIGIGVKTLSAKYAPLEIL